MTAVAQDRSVREAASGRALVQFSGVSCGYDSRAVLRDIDLTIEEGAFVGIVGPSGAGKTTLLRAIVGAVPLFFYVVHIYVLSLLAMILAWAQGGELQRIEAVAAPETIPPWYGLPLPGVYAAWALVVLVMYPLCRWFARLKRERRDWWLSYL